MAGSSAAAGSVYLVGAGPGDPGLLTLRAAEVLCDAEILLYDALVADAIVNLVPPSCEKIFVGKRRGERAMTQAEIEDTLVRKACEGHRVVRLKGGDPFVFGRGGEEAQALRRAGIPFEVVPGVSSALAAPAYAGIPLTHRDWNAAFTVLTGQENPEKPLSTLDWERLADPHRTLVLLMATANLSEIVERLVSHGLSPQTPVAVVQDGTRPTQRTAVGTLATIVDDVAAQGIGSPAVVVVGDVVRLRAEIRWFDTGPLFGKSVLVTRAGHQSDAFARALLARGATPILAPTIAIERPDDADATQRAVQELAGYAWLVFTSQNGVDIFFEQLEARGADARAIGGAKVAAIGDQTAARLCERGVRADLVPPAFVGEELAASLIDRSRPGDRILIVQAQDAREVLSQTLERAGRGVTAIAAYKTTLAAPDPSFAQHVAHADVLTFTSASTVKGFSALLGGNAAAAAAAGSKCVACIGPITAEAARAAGLHVDVTARTHTMAGLLQALETHFTPS